MFPSWIQGTATGSILSILLHAGSALQSITQTMLKNSIKHRTLGKFSTSSCRQVSCTKSSHNIQNMIPDEPVFGHFELDSHANACVQGPNFIVLSFTGCECDVSPYSESYDALQDVPIVTGATAWTCQESGETFILVFNEGLWMPSAMSNSLGNPNQLQSYGSHVQDDPYSGAPLYIESVDGNLTIPLQTKGTVIFTTTMLE